MNIKKPRERWITAYGLRMITGWDKNKMAKARRLEWVKYKPSEGGGYLYLLESIPETLKIKV